MESDNVVRNWNIAGVVVFIATANGVRNSRQVTWLYKVGIGLTADARLTAQIGVSAVFLGFNLLDFVFDSGNLFPEVTRLLDKPGQSWVVCWPHFYLPV